VTFLQFDAEKAVSADNTGCVLVWDPRAPRKRPAETIRLSGAMYGEPDVSRGKLIPCCSTSATYVNQLRTMIISTLNESMHLLEYVSYVLRRSC
jgi:hypothetical protein